MPASTTPDARPPERRAPGWRRTAATVLTWIVVAVVTANGFLVSAVVLRQYATTSDLHVYVGAVRASAHGSLYDFAVSDGRGFTYPPFSAAILQPVVQVPESALRIAWPIAMLLAAAAIGVIMAPHAAQRLSRYWPPRDWRRTPALPLAVALVLASGTVSSNLVSGQVSLFIALLALLDICRLVPARFQGIATGVSAAIKLTPLIFVPYYWFTGRRRTAVTSLVTFVVCGGIGWVVYPSDSVRYWFGALWHFDRVAPAAAPGNQSVNGILARLGLAGPPELVIWIALSAAIVCVAMMRGVRADRGGHALLGGAIVGAASICVSPVSWEHHTIWLVLSIVGVVWAGSRRQLAWPLIVVVVMLTLRPYALMTYHWLPASFVKVATNAEVLLALAVACLVPFAEVARRRGRAPVATETAPPVTDAGDRAATGDAR